MLSFSNGTFMLEISDADVARRITRDNPWWSERARSTIPEGEYRKRVYFEPFKALALDFKVKRAAVLLGPRRVGKTVIVKQLILDAIDEGIDPKNVLYASIDVPFYAQMPLEKFLSFIPGNQENPCLVVFDEIQYLKNWEAHLKDLVDSRPNIKFIATGSAAAALKLKSTESGAGRFSEFILPPLTFHEFLIFCDRDEELIKVVEEDERHIYLAKDIDELNTSFIDYLNFGGYPEVVLNERVRANPEQFVKNDIIDKVLLKDLPSLYGINDIQELNTLFSLIAFNSGSESSLDKISRRSEISKPTIRKYVEYLESAFLVIKLPTVDENCRPMQRERNFKLYLSNPSMRAAMFAPVSKEEHETIGHLAEAAIFSQWQHAATFSKLSYSRWREGEVDVVYTDTATSKPQWIGEVKWSNRVESNFGDVTRGLERLLKRHPSIHSCFLTTKTYSGNSALEGRELTIVPSALYCYTVGRNITRQLVDAPNMGLNRRAV